MGSLEYNHRNRVSAWFPEGSPQLARLKELGMDQLASCVTTEDVWFSWPDQDPNLPVRFWKKNSLIRYNPTDGTPKEILEGFARGEAFIDATPYVINLVREYYLNQRKATRR